MELAMLKHSRNYIPVLAIALFIAGCRQASSSPEGQLLEEASEETAELVSDTDEEVTRLRSEISDLERRLADAESAASEAKERADEAHDLAREAESKAEDACKPFGYQFGCGNSR
jgi:uncharacterized protein YlxW (UPF0749 family)